MFCFSLYKHFQIQLERFWNTEKDIDILFIIHEHVKKKTKKKQLLSTKIS